MSSIFNLGNDGYDTIVREPSLSGKFTKLGVPDRTSSQNIYASPDTQKSLSNVHPELIGTAAEVSGADNIIFVSNEDIYPITKILDKLDGVPLDATHTVGYGNYGDAFDEFRKKFSDPPPIIDAKAAGHAYNENASAGFFKHENGQTYCTIALPPLDEGADNSFRALAGVKDTMTNQEGEKTWTKTNIPRLDAIDKASAASDVFHEAGHCAKGHSNTDANEGKILHQEQEAQIIGDAATEHLFPNIGEAVTKIKEDSRAVGSMNYLDKPHHNINLDLHRDPSVSAQSQIDSMKVIDQAITKQAAKGMHSTLNEAKIALEEDPKFKHATLDKLSQSGEFKDDPVAQKYVDEYMSAGERRVPEYFGVKPDESIASNSAKAPDAREEPLPSAPAPSGM